MQSQHPKAIINHSKITIEHFPDEVLLLLLSFMKVDIALLLSQTNRRFNALIYENNLWPIYYKQRFHKDIPLHSGRRFRDLFIDRQKLRMDSQDGFSSDYKKLLLLVQKADTQELKKFVQEKKEQAKPKNFVKKCWEYTVKVFAENSLSLLAEIESGLEPEVKADASVFYSIMQHENPLLRQQLFDLLYQFINVILLQKVMILHWAVRCHQLPEEIDRLYKLGYQMLLANNGDNLLHSATRAGADPELIDHLIRKYKLSPSNRNKDDHGCIYYAIANHHNNQVSYFIDNKNDPDVYLHVSVQFGNMFAVEKLFEKFGEAIVPMLKRFMLSVTYNSKVTPTGLAILGQNAKFLRNFLEFITAQEIETAPLINAFMQVRGPSGKLGKRLATRHAELYLGLLQAAVKLNQPEMVRVLFEYGAQANYVPQYVDTNKSALMLAIRRHFDEIVKIIIQEDPSSLKFISKDETALNYARDHSFSECERELLILAGARVGERLNPRTAEEFLFATDFKKDCKLQDEMDIRKLLTLNTDKPLRQQVIAFLTTMEAQQPRSNWGGWINLMYSSPQKQYQSLLDDVKAVCDEDFNLQVLSASMDKHFGATRPMELKILEEYVGNSLRRMSLMPGKKI